MKDLIVNTLLLTVTCVVASGLLAAVNKGTRQRIARNKIEKEVNALRGMVPEAADFDKETVNGVEISIGKSSSGEKICRIVKSSARGYSGSIRMLVAVGADGLCKAVSVLEQSETPGLGARVTGTKFQDRFKGKKLEEIKLKQNGGEIDALTGATISSRAVVAAVREGMRLLKEAER